MPRAATPKLEAGSVALVSSPSTAMHAVKTTPRSVFFLDTHQAGPLSGCAAQLERCAALGYDTVLLSSPFCEYDPDRLLPSLDYQGSALAGLSLLAREARVVGLGLYLEVTLDRAAADSRVAKATPDSFRPLSVASEAAMDPRSRSSLPSSLQLAAGPGKLAAVTAWWLTQIESWLDAGIDGFRLISSPRFSSLQHSLIERLAPRAGFIDWIPTSSLQRGASPDFDRAHDAVALLARIHTDRPTQSNGQSNGQNNGMGDGLACACCQAMAIAKGSIDGMLQAMPLEHSAEAAAPWHTTQRVGSLLPATPGMKVQRLSAAHAPVSAMLGTDPDQTLESRGLLVLANTDTRHEQHVDADALLARSGTTGPFHRLDVAESSAADESSEVLDTGSALSLAPGEVRIYRAEGTPVERRAPERGPDVNQALTAARIVIARLEPDVDNGRYPVKRVIGDTLVVEADVFADGHDEIAVVLLWRPLGAKLWQESPMQPLGNDRFRGRFTLPALGRHEFTIEAWRDTWAIFRGELRKKHSAGQSLKLEIREGVELIEAAAAHAKKSLAAPLRALLKKLAAADNAAAIALLLDVQTAAAMTAVDPRPFATRHTPCAQVDAERSAANFGAWYEIFPRSMSGDHQRHGNFDDVIKALPRIREMGFDVLYMPPIHPIGTTNRKGKNNTLTPGDDDHGSPYAVGSPDGGHDAIHPQLGTLEDFRRLRAAAAKHGLELALDFAIQCSPDHPWLKQHPEWFSWRADGSIKYAENPPKKYEDIVNLDFYAEGAKPALWNALRDVILHWVREGVQIFRVDNPHTKPLPFWEWLIADIRAVHPSVIFLAEAFTRPGPMQQLAKIGFSQSYTYFTWRNTKQELTEYLTELTTTSVGDYFRPHFFVNTPDINPRFLQHSGRAGHLIRAALAATLSGLWGVYSGFELCDAAALPGKEEYLDSEKYQIRVWDWHRPGHITREISELNRLRRENPALQSHFGLEFFKADNDQILWFEKATASRDNVLLIAVNLDPHQSQSALVELPLWRWSLPDHAALQVEDLLDGSRFVWHGKTQEIRLDPAKPYSIWRVQPVQ